MKNKFLTKLLCFVISIMMIIPTGISFVAAAGEEDPFTALASYGGYADTTTETNLEIYSNENNAVADVYMYDMTIPEEKAIVDAFALTDANTKSVLDANPGVRYVCIGNSDSAWRTETKSDGDVEKSVMFTTKYVRNRPSSAWVGGSVYFKATDVFTKDDNDLTFIVEYLDEGTTNINIQYVNSAFDGTAVSVSNASLPRTNTGKWVTNVVSVTDANIAVGLTNTALADRKQTIKVMSNDIDTYISKFMVVKTSDYQAYLDGTLSGGDDSDDGNQGNQQPDGIDFELLSNYGAYIDADTHTDAVGTNIVATCESTADGSLLNDPTWKYSNLLADLSIQANMDAVNADTQAKTNYENNKPVYYSNLGNQDGAWMFKEGASTSGVTHNSFFTSKYITKRSDWGACMQGKIYFRVTDLFTAADKDLTFIIEYLDKGTAKLTLNYTNQAFVQGTSASTERVSTSQYPITRTDSGEWKQAVISVTDVNVAAGLKWTALADKTSQLFIDAASTDTYISKLLIVKTEDYNKYLAGELTESDETVVANAKAALKLDVTEVKADFTLPTVDGVEVTWASNNAAIAIDGNNAVVTQGAADTVVTLTATIKKNDVSDTKTFTVTVPAKYTKSTGVELIIGASIDEDIVSGKIAFDAFNTLFKRDEPETATGRNLMYESPQTADFDSMRVMAGPEGDKRWAAFTSTYYRPNRTNSVVGNGNIAFNVEAYTTEDKKLTIAIDYLDVGTSALSFTYVNGPDPDNKLGGEIPSVAATTVTRGNTGEWKTVTINATDAYFENSQLTNRGASNKADIRVDGSDIYISRIEVYTGNYPQLKEAINALTLDGVTDDNGISVATGYVETNFTLPATLDEIPGATVEWSSADDSVIAIDGTTAKINPSEDMRAKVTLTATIVVGEYYAQKSFDITLAKKPKQGVLCSDPVITGAGTAAAAASIDVAGAGNLMGQDVILMVASTDSASGEIKDITVERKEVTEAEFTISATVDNTSGTIKCYLTTENGASLYNAAPSPISNYKVVSGTSGVNVMWDAAADDFDYIDKYVVYDGDGNMVDELSGDETSYFAPVAAGITKSFAVEGFDHAGLSTGKTEVQSGSLFAAEGITVKLYDLNGAGSNAAMFNDYPTQPNTDNHTHAKVMTDAVTGESLLCRHTFTRTAGVCACGTVCERTGGTFLYFKPDGKYVTKNTKEVAVIVKYFDYGTGNVGAQYNTVADMDSGKQASGSYSFALTGTNTFKTHVIKITDAGFYSPSTLSYADIRFSGGYNGQVYIAEVTMMPLENYAEMPTPELYIAADSIAANYSEAQIAQDGIVGWGMIMPSLLKNGATVVNKAVPGASTKTFPNMSTILSNAEKNDYVLMSFGHNDSETDSAGVTVEEFTANMENFVINVRETGATPVIITAIPQVNLSTGKLIYDKANPDGIMKYRDAALDVADRMDVLTIDLAAKMAEKASTMSADQVKALYANEVTHLSQAGAEFAAQIIAEALKDADFGLVSNYVK